MLSMGVTLQEVSLRYGYDWRLKRRWHKVICHIVKLMRQKSAHQSKSLTFPHHAPTPCTKRQQRNKQPPGMPPAASRCALLHSKMWTWVQSSLHWKGNNQFWGPGLYKGQPQDNCRARTVLHKSAYFRSVLHWHSSSLTAQLKTHRHT